MNIIAQNKKIITLSTVLLSALLLTGCGINSSQSTNNSSTNHNHSSKVVKTHETKPSHATTNKSDDNSISSDSSANFNSPSPLASSTSAQSSPETTQSVPADSNINPQSNTQTSSSALSAPQNAANNQFTPSDYNPTTTPTYQLTDADVINNFINDSGLVINQGDELSVAPVDVKAGIYQLELRHTDNTNPQVAHLTTLYTYNVNTHTYSVTYQASNPTQTTQQLSLNDTATWSDPDGTIHHVNSDGLDTITTLTGQTIYQDWVGPLPANAQIVHN